ncbi:MAG: RNA-binding domain-containing protein [Candidatus Thorarchaeota archaeon]
MAFVAKIEARAYSRATEVSDKVVNAILNLYPEHVHELVKFVSTKVEGHSGNQIQIIGSELSDQTGCETTLDYIFGKLEKRDRERLENSLDRRIDENCQFFVRIDKQAAFLERIVLAKGPDVISVQVHIRKHPRCKQEDVMTMLEDRLRAAGGDDQW